MVTPSQKKEVSPTVDENGDYIFRFSISPREIRDEPLVDFVRYQLADLLQIVVLTHNGKRVNVNGFLFLDNAEREHKIWVEKR